MDAVMTDLPHTLSPRTPRRARSDPAGVDHDRPFLVIGTTDHVP
jgi:hypothetical protein